MIFNGIHEISIKTSLSPILIVSANIVQSDPMSLFTMFLCYSYLPEKKVSWIKIKLLVVVLDLDDIRVDS